MITGKVILEKICTRKFVLRSTLSYENNKYKITVTDGIVTDGASLPKIFWTLFGSPFTGKYLEGAIIHDALYGSKITSRKEADEIFLEMMLCNGTNKIKAHLMYWAVRVFGKPAFGKNKDFIDINDIDIEVKDV